MEERRIVVVGVEGGRGRGEGNENNNKIWELGVPPNLPLGILGEAFSLF